MSRIAIPQKLASLLKNQLSGNDITKVTADKSAVLVRELLKHSHRNDIFEDWINIHHQKLHDLVGKRNYVSIISELERNKVLYRTNSFYAGNAPEQYPDLEPFPKAIALDAKYRSRSQSEFWQLSTVHSMKAVDKSYKTKAKTDIAKSLREFFPLFKFEFSDSDYNTKELRNAWNLENVEAIENEKFYLSEDNFSGRIHSSFTQLSSVLRKQLLAEGKEVKSLDISSMAPLGIGWLVREGLDSSFLELDSMEGREGGREAGLVLSNYLSSLNNVIHNSVVTPHFTLPNRATGCYLSMTEHLQCNDLLLNQKKNPCFIDSNSNLTLQKLAKNDSENASWSIPKSNNTNKRVKGWIDDCQSGDLYPRIRSLIPTTDQRFEYCDVRTRNRFTVDLSKLSPKAFKKQVLTVIYDRNEQSIKNPVWKIIQRQYPEIAEFIYQIKADDRHREMSRLTQSLERKIMVDCIAREHFEHGLPIVTVHDEIITATPNDTRRIMKSSFADIGLSPTIK